MQVGHIKKLQKGIQNIQNGKMPRRLLHATCGITSVSGSQTSSGTLTMSYPATSSSRLSPKPMPIFDDDDSFSADQIPSREESFA